MTRIDTPLVQPAADKPVDKTTGKTSAKDGDGRQAAFRSLLRQLGGQTGASNGGADKEAKAAPDDVSHAPPPLRHRTGSKEDKTMAASADVVAAMPPAEPAATCEPALGWQAILGTGERQEQSPVAADLAAELGIDPATAVRRPPSSRIHE